MFRLFHVLDLSGVNKSVILNWLKNDILGKSNANNIYSSVLFVQNITCNNLSFPQV